MNAESKAVIDAATATKKQIEGTIEASEDFTKLWGTDQGAQASNIYDQFSTQYLKMDDGRYRYVNEAGEETFYDDEAAAWKAFTGKGGIGSTMFGGMSKDTVEQFMYYLDLWQHADTDEQRAKAQAEAMRLVADATNKAVTAVKSLQSALSSLPNNADDLKSLVDQLNGLGQTINGEAITAENLTNLYRNSPGEY